MYLIKLTAKCETTISPRTEMIVPGIVNEDNNSLYRLTEYPRTDYSFKGVLMTSSLLNLSRNVIPVRVVNVGEKARVIKEGEVLAACAPVTCINQNLQVTLAESSDTLIREILQSAELNPEQRSAVEG